MIHHFYALLHSGHLTYWIVHYQEIPAGVKEDDVNEKGASAADLDADDPTIANESDSEDETES